MTRGLSGEQENRLAQIAPSRTTIYVEYLNVQDEWESPGAKGWAWGESPDDTDLFDYDGGEELSYIADPDLTDEELENLVKEQVADDVEVVIDRTNAPKFNPRQFKED